MKTACELIERLDPSQRAERQALFEEQERNILVYTDLDFKKILDRFNATYAEFDAFVKPFIDPVFDRSGSPNSQPLCLP